MKKYVKTPTVFQMEATECGAASLAMVFAYFGKHIPLEKMRIETGVSRDGCNAGNIMRCAKKFGFDCHGYRKEPDELKELKPPCIIHWNFNHFVVLEGFKGKSVYINDPAMGRRKISTEEFDEAFTGIVLTFEPTHSFTKEKKKSTFFSFVKKRINGQVSTLIKLIFIGFLLVFPGLIIPITSQVFIDDVLVGGNKDIFLGVILFLIGSVLIQGTLAFYRSLILAKLQKKMVLLSARDFLNHMFRLPISFFDQRYMGDLSSRVSNNANVSVFLSGSLAETTLNILVVAFYLVLLFLYSPILTGVALISVAVNVVVVKLTSNMITNASTKFQQDAGKLSGAVCAGLSITSTLKASGAENEYISRILGYNAKTISTEQKISRSQHIINAIPHAVKMLADVIILLLGGTLVINGKMTAGMLIAFTALFGSFSEPIDKLVGFVKSIQTTKADVNRVEDIMNYPLDSKFQENLEKQNMNNKLEGSVELSDVSFGYSRLKPPIVSDFSFKISCGQSIAFVGSSGCGKSTISKVISGLYSPWGGKIYFDGIEAEKIPNEIINASISTVSQNITLFSGSIRDNLTMWNDSVSESDMIAAAKDACIHDIISQKTGAYEYRLSEGGSNLSGGQRQRLEIARALVTNPTVLIMDEATSALDPIVEKQIIDNIKRRGCTCIIVAHRLSAIRDCDQIIVMSGGKIIQRGTHDELSKVDGHYKNFVKNL